MWLNNGVWVKGPPPKAPHKGPNVITHRAQRTAVPPAGRRLDALLDGRARIMVRRCLAGNTKILMSDGSLRHIKDVKRGDTVISQDGLPTKVLTKTYSGRAKKLVRVRSGRMLDPITCTPEHKFLVFDLRGIRIPSNPGLLYYVRREDSESRVKWVSAEDLGPDTFLLRPAEILLETTKKSQIDLANYVPTCGTSKITDSAIISVGKQHQTSLQEIADLVGSTYWQAAEVSRGRVKFTKDIHFRLKKELEKREYHTKTKRFLSVGYDLGKFFGIILGDGSHRIRYKNGVPSSGEISIAVNSDYLDHVAEIKRVISDLFGLEVSSYQNKSRKIKCVQLVFYSLPIARMLSGFGQKAEKKLPSEFLFNDDEYLRGVLDGLIQTDGYTRGRHIAFDNTSPHLVSLCYWLFNRIGRNPKVSHCKKRECVLSSGRVIKGTCDSFKVWCLTHQNSQSHQRMKYNGCIYDLSAITYKETLNDQDQDVWDIGVESGHSFIAENTIVHNSLGGLGDIIMATPIARGARRKYPDAHITYAVPTEYGGGDLVALLQHNPFIDEIMDYRIANRNDYDVYVDITRTGLSDEKPYTIPLNRIDLFANAAGIPLFGNSTPIYVMTEEERQWGQDFVKKIIGARKYKGLISIHLGSRDPKRSWPQYRIREFVKLATAAGYFCFLYEWGASSDEWRLARTERVFDYGIRQAAAILEATDVLVCPDSMMLHLAGALSIKTVSLFGSMPPACRINHYPNAIAVVNQQISCIGCMYAPCQNNFYCMSSILPQAVLEAVDIKMKADIIEPMSDPVGAMVRPGASVKKTINTFSI